MRKLTILVDLDDTIEGLLQAWVNYLNTHHGTGFVTCITDTFLRGSNLNDAVIIIDEAQNFTVPQLKKVLTRIGKKAKVIVIGHELQCDLDNPEDSGFTTYIKHFEEKDRVAICKLTQNYRSRISQWARRSIGGIIWK